jgi:alanine racemase
MQSVLNNSLKKQSNKSIVRATRSGKALEGKGKIMRRRNFLHVMGLGSLATLSPLKQREVSAQEPEKDERWGSMDPWIEVNLDHIVWNLNQLKKLVKVPIMAVVKANAYGHGLVGVSQYLEKNGVDWLMVGKLEEALTLRKAGLRCPILNYGPFSREDGEEIVNGNISQSVYSEEATYLNEMASKLNKKVGVHIDIDTGMGRTGVPFTQALALVEKLSSLSHLEIQGISTTLTEDKEFDQEQLKRFLTLCFSAEMKGISLGLKHAASSAGVLYEPTYYLDMVRPGIALYGYYPSSQTQKEDKLALKPALRLLAKVTSVRDLAPGESLSYHRVFVAPKKMRVATIGIGYSDGYPSQLVGKGAVSISNKKYSVIAAVTANHLMVDLENNPEIKVADEVILIDNQKQTGLGADVLSEWSGISDYKILIGLNPLLPRKYIKLQESA